MMEIITVSEKARIQIQKLLEEQKLNKETHFLRVGVNVVVVQECLMNWDLTLYHKKVII